MRRKVIYTFILAISLILSSCVNSSANSGSEQLPAWSNPKAIIINGGVDGLTCSTPTFCAAFNKGGYVTLFNGSSWSKPVLFNSHWGPNSVSCPVKLVCMASETLGGQIFYLSNKSTWSASIQVFPIYMHVSVSCATPTFCVAVSGSFDPNPGEVSYFNGSKWTDPVVLSPNHGFERISCPTSTFCAAQTTGGLYTWNSHQWTFSSTSNLPYFITLSCASATFCVAGNILGKVVIFNGNSWSKPKQVVNSGEGLSTLSCPIVNYCVGLIQKEHTKVIILSKGSWKEYENTGISPATYFISCSAVDKCIAIGGNNPSWQEMIRPITQT